MLNKNSLLSQAKYWLILLVLSLPLGLSVVNAEEAASPAQENAPALSSNVCQGELQGEAWFDRTHDYLSTNVCETAIWFDRFFGDPRDVEENADRFIRIVNALEWDELDELNYRIKVRARIELPRFKRFGKSLSLILTGEDESDINNVFPEDEQIIEDNPTSQGDTEAKRALSLLWDVQKDAQSSFSVGSSIRLRSRLKPLFNVRYRYTYGWDKEHLVRATQNLFWEEDEGFGERTRLDYEILLKPKTLLRWSASGMYSQKSEGFEWGVGASLFHHLSTKRSLSLDWTTQGDTEPTSEINQHRLGMRYRQNFYRPWLFFEIEPAMFWPLEDDHHLNFGIALRLEIQLGRKRNQ